MTADRRAPHRRRRRPIRPLEGVGSQITPLISQTQPSHGDSEVRFRDRRDRMGGDGDD